MTVFVGARPYLLTEQEARRLGQLRATFKDEKTDEAVAALRLASALELLVDEGLDEPLEIGWPQAAAVDDRGALPTSGQRPCASR